MKLNRQIRMTAVIVMAVVISLVHAGCSSDRKEAPERETAVLSIRVTLHDDVPAGHPGKSPNRAGEYEADKFSANDMEKMHTLRIIIIGSDNTVEHNTLWDMTGSPGEFVSGGDFPVRAGDMKTILFVANEEGKRVRIQDGTLIPVSDYLGKLSAAVGESVDPDALRKAVIPDSEIVTDSRTGMLASPLLITGIYRYYIDTDRDRYSATFNIHRTLSKYTFRVTNKSKDKPHKLDFIEIDRVASYCWLFPDAEYQDYLQTILTGYVAADPSPGKINTYTESATIAPGETREFGPYYLPEGADLGSSGKYSVRFGFEGFSTGWRSLQWFKPEIPGETFPMTDLPRNTHVVVNVKFDLLELDLNYTVCPWETHDIVIPPFN